MSSGKKSYDMEFKRLFDGTVRWWFVEFASDLRDMVHSFSIFDNI